MSFGLRNAAQTFQWLIDEVLHGLHFCLGYIDDLLVASATPEEDLQHLRLVLERLEQHGIVINVPKNVISRVPGSPCGLLRHLAAGENDPGCPRFPTPYFESQTPGIFRTNQFLS